MAIILATLLMTHLTIVSVTLYLHRCQAHRGVEFHPVLSHAMRFWLWMTTGMTTKQWVAVHRKHHRFSDVEGDPHTPHVYGIWQVLFKGAGLYHLASKVLTGLNCICDFSLAKIKKLLRISSYQLYTAKFQNLSLTVASSSSTFSWVSLYN